MIEVDWSNADCYITALAHLLSVLIILLVILWYGRNFKQIKETQMSQETELQEAKAVLDVVSAGVTEIISRLNNIPNPTDNPAIQDEIDSG